MKYLVGLSGGLDSTYTAFQLKQSGAEVEGAVLKMGDFTDISGAELAALTVGIKLNIIDCSSRFNDTVISYFIDEYKAGRTPNPCTVCNREIKIRELCRFAADNGFDKVITGHYAEIGNENGKYFVRRAKDSKKDQSYMLWMLTQAELSLLDTPLYRLTKEEIRENARSFGLEHFASIPESQDVCFIPDGDYVKFIENRIGSVPTGNFIDGNGNVLGKHKGIIHYTVGQKKGLGIALGKPYTVTKINASDNTVTIVPSESESLSYTKTVRVCNLNFQSIPTITEGEICGLAKIRYAASLTPARAVFCGDVAELTFDLPARAVTSGQSLVFYQDDKIAFGGRFC